MTSESKQFPEVTWKQKLFVLILLVIQNAFVTLFTRYSKGILKETYLASTGVFMTELGKFTICVGAIYGHTGQSFLHQQNWSIFQKIQYLIKTSGYAWVPAGCYFIQNSLQYVALEHLPSAVYACLQQLKILSAAILSWAILKKKIPYYQWRALLLLILGGVLVQYHTFETKENNTVQGNLWKGTTAIFTIVTLSGIAGVSTQKLLQTNDAHRQQSIWDRNLQLSFWSIIFACLSLFQDRHTLIEYGFFGGWSIYTCICVSLWIIGGFLVALIIKYLDVIIKGFASAISLIVISIVGYYVFGDALDIIFGVGAGVIIIATFNYNDKPKAPEPTS